MATEIDTTNQQAVGVRGEQITLTLPWIWMTPDEALRHAAWLVALAEPLTETRFADVLEAVRNT